eukprot:TRINITY_DN1965_c0_g1_i3.p1 TRINITY_DN1965_c0_g1~~TRINITY_DN1965_c0_g1_i3.p1  ORF type:complete len:359 (+),score=110.01 TRINITY_DN1965_c0_g1_i3:40-1077(+)
MSAAVEVGRRKLGKEGLEVSSLGLGCMGMSAFYGPPKPEQELVHLIHQAVALGITFLDTSDFYGPHTNEILLGKALKGIRDKVQLATKFGVSVENGKHAARGTPEYVRKCCEDSLKRLDVDCIDLYYQHRVDRTVPIEITVGEMKKLVEEGKVKYLGLSEASADTIRRAHAVHPISAVQLEWSLWTRDIEKEIVPLCRELGIGIVPYSPLGRGFFSGKATAEQLAEGDVRKLIHPRFNESSLQQNRMLLERVQEIAGRKGCSSGQLALAWVLHQGDDVIPIPGTTKLTNLKENVAALGVTLTAKELAEIAEAVPVEAVAGDRYPEGAKRWCWDTADTPPLAAWRP